MRKLALAFTVFGVVLAGGVPAARASVVRSADSSQALYAQFRAVDDRTRDGQVAGSSGQELVRYRGYSPYNRYRSPSSYRGYRGPGYYYGGPRYDRGPGYYRYPDSYRYRGYSPYRYGVPYYGGGWGFGGPGFYFGFGF